MKNRFDLVTGCCTYVSWSCYAVWQMGWNILNSTISSGTDVRTLISGCKTLSSMRSANLMQVKIKFPYHITSIRIMCACDECIDLCIRWYTLYTLQDINSIWLNHTDKCSILQDIINKAEKNNDVKHVFSYGKTVTFFNFHSKFFRMKFCTHIRSDGVFSVV